MNTPSTLRPKGQPTPLRREGGSVLIVAMLFAIIIGIALATSLNLSNSSLKFGLRNFYTNSAMNLAETGLERAMYSVHQYQIANQSLAVAWNGWTTNTTTHVATRSFSGYNLGPNATGTIKVYVKNYDLAGQVEMVANSTVIPGTGNVPLQKFIKVTLTKRSPFPGLIAKDSFTGDSNLYVDSWLSTDPSTGAISAYSSGVKKANGSLGVVNAANGTLNLGDNPKIYGSLSTGGGNVSKTGSAILTNSVTGSGWDTGTPSLINKSFTYSFPTVTVPTPSAVNNIAASITTSQSFPRVGDTAAADGKYYYNFASGAVVSYASNTLTVTKPVVFIMTNHAGVNVVKTTSSATFKYGTAAGDTGSFSLYTNGNLSFDSGFTWFANKAPANTTIFGTNPTSQSFDTHGQGTLYGSIIAENAAITYDSGGDIMGSFVSKSITLKGGVKFHYDESLSGADGGGYKPTQWTELQSASERAAYASVLNF